MGGRGSCDCSHSVRQIAHGDSFTANNEQEKKVLSLMNDIKVVTSSVYGSASSRLNMRNQIRSMIMSYGLPTFYVTINPADVFHPLVGVLTSTDLDVDEMLSKKFVFELSSTKKTYQGYAIAKNPFLGARFFHVMMKSFFKGLLGFDGKKSGGTGILGVPKGYYGFVEAQGRGTLHCHMLIWLEGVLSPDAMKERLSNDTDFKCRLFTYLAMEAVWRFDYN
ncbi:hypothetical protein PM082_024971 [Marasmius tenuissimus]|nr:hypothetical protein PM082_024971 [Marasmius tenuissimus]